MNNRVISFSAKTVPEAGPARRRDNLTEQNKRGKAFSLSWLPRGRWNVLDLIDMGRKAVPTYLFCDIDMTWAEELRKTLAAYGHKVTVTAILLKAIAVAQRAHPASRTALLPWGRVVTFNRIVAGFTVERFVDCGPAVFFGAILDADSKPVEQIAQELRDYAEKEIHQIPQLEVEDRFAGMPWLLRKLILFLGACLPSIRLRYQGATFGLSTLGKYGLRTIVPPSVCTSIFGVGVVEDRPVARNGQVEIRPMMTLTLNFDHRLIDGAPAARFLAEIRDLLQGGLAQHIREEVGDIIARINVPEPVVLPVVSPEEQVLTL